MKLYFIRHAESEANAKNILASQLDFPLSDKGHDDARQIAGKFRRYTHIDSIFSSPLQRAKQTAQAFSDVFTLDVTMRSELIEQHLGRFCGMHYSDLESQADYEHDRRARWTWVPAGGGESYEMIADRLLPFFENLTGHIKGQHILIVTHAVAMRLIRGLLENTLPVYPEKIPANGEVWEVNYQGLGQPHEIRSLFFTDGHAAVHRA